MPTAPPSSSRHSQLIPEVAAFIPDGDPNVELRARRTRTQRTARAITAQEAASALRFDRKTIELKVRQHLEGWRTLLSTKHIQDGRQLLREMLAAPLRFTPEGKTHRFEGEASIGAMLARNAGVAPFLVAVRGFVDGCNVKFSGIAA